MSDVTEILTIAVGSGGAASTLVAVFRTWFAERKASHKMRITVKNGDRALTITGDLTEQEIRQALRSIGEKLDQHSLELPKRPPSQPN